MRTSATRMRGIFLPASKSRQEKVVSTSPAVINGCEASAPVSCSTRSRTTTAPAGRNITERTLGVLDGYSDASAKRAICVGARNGIAAIAIRRKKIAPAIQISLRRRDFPDSIFTVSGRTNRGSSFDDTLHDNRALDGS